MLRLLLGLYLATEVIGWGLGKYMCACTQYSWHRPPTTVLQKKVSPNPRSAVIIIYIFRGRLESSLDTFFLYITQRRHIEQILYYYNNKNPTETQNTRSRIITVKTNIPTSISRKTLIITIPNKPDLDYPNAMRN